MTKRVCDICGKEIFGDDYCDMGDANYCRLRDNDKDENFVHEYCLDCAEKIQELIYIISEDSEI
jgi:hypothetical protein